MARRALLIGCSKYAHLDPLGSAGRDVARLAAVLGDPAIGNFEVTCLSGDPENHRTRAAIEAFFADADTDDTVLLYIASHGFRGSDRRFHFALHDTNPKFLLGTAIPADFIERAMRQCPSKDQLLVVDCCCIPSPGDEKVTGTSGAMEPSDLDFDGGTKVVLAAVSRSPMAFGPLGHSRFVRTVLDGLVGGHATSAGDWITPAGLYDHLLQGYRARGDAEVPRLWGQGGQTFDLARPQKPISEKLEAALRSEDAAVRRNAIVELVPRLSRPEAAAAVRYRLEALLREPSEGGDADPSVRRAAHDVLRQPVGRAVGKGLDPNAAWDQTPSVPMQAHPGGLSKRGAELRLPGGKRERNQNRRGSRRGWFSAGAGSLLVVGFAWSVWDGRPAEGIGDAPRHASQAYARDDDAHASRQAAVLPAHEVPAPIEPPGETLADQAVVDEDDPVAVASERPPTEEAVASSTEEAVASSTGESPGGGPPPRASTTRRPTPKGCGGSDPTRCYLQAMKAHGVGSHLEARIGFESACEAGHADACFRLGSYYDWGKGGLPTDRARAADLYRDACESGRGAACHALAGFHAKGKSGLAHDKAKAAEYYRQACDQGWIEGCYTLGVYLEEGRGVARDEAQALARFSRACADGHARACESVGQYHLEGRGALSRDPSSAASFFGRACQLGRPGACALQVRLEVP